MTVPTTTENTPPEKKKTWISSRISYVLLAILIVYIGFSFFGNSLLKKGTIAPDWTLVTADGTGDKLSLNSLLGKTVILDFWSTTCPPCMREMKELKNIRMKLGEKEVEIIGIAAGGESVVEITEFKERRKIPHTLVVDRSGSVSDSYLVKSLPTIYIIDREGRIFDSHAGFWDSSEILASLARMPKP